MSSLIIGKAEFLTTILKDDVNILKFKKFLDSEEGEVTKFIWENCSSFTINQDFINKYEKMINNGILSQDVLDRAISLIENSG